MIALLVRSAVFAIAVPLPFMFTEYSRKRNVVHLVAVWSTFMLIFVICFPNP
jgi:hypothetical protein